MKVITPQQSARQVVNVRQRRAPFNRECSDNSQGRLLNAPGKNGLTCQRIELEVKPESGRKPRRSRRSHAKFELNLCQVSHGSTAKIFRAAQHDTNRPRV